MKFYKYFTLFTLQGPFFQSEVNPNLIAIVPSIVPPPAIDSGKLTADSTSKPSEINIKTLPVTNKELNQNSEKNETKADVKKTEKIDPPHRVPGEHYLFILQNNICFVIDEIRLV